MLSWLGSNYVGAHGLHIIMEILLILQTVASPHGCSHSVDDKRNGQNIDERDDDGNNFHEDDQDGDGEDGDDSDSEGNGDGDPDQEREADEEAFEGDR